MLISNKSNFYAIKLYSNFTKYYFFIFPIYVYLPSFQFLRHFLLSKCLHLSLLNHEFLALFARGSFSSSFKGLFYITSTNDLSIFNSVYSLVSSLEHFYFFYGFEQFIFPHDGILNYNSNIPNYVQILLYFYWPLILIQLFLLQCIGCIISIVCK